MRSILAILFVFLTVGLFAQVPNGPYLRLSTFTEADTTKVPAINGVVGTHGNYLTLYLNDQLQVLNKGANNGLTGTYGYYQLGGDLIKNTAIGGNTFTLTFNDSRVAFRSPSSAANIFDIQNSGGSALLRVDYTGSLYRLRTPTNFDLIDLKSNGNLNLTSTAGQLTLIGNTTYPIATSGGKLLLNEVTGYSNLNIDPRPDDPGTLSNGDIWINESLNKVRARMSGTTYSLATEGYVGGAYMPLSGTGTLTGNLTIDGNYDLILGSNLTSRLNAIYADVDTEYSFQATDLPNQSGFNATSTYAELAATDGTHNARVKIAVDELDIIVPDGYASISATDEFYLTGGAIILEGIIANTNVSPSQITSNQNNYAPANAGWYRLSSDASRDITGWIAPIADGDLLEIHNVGSFDINFPHEDTDSDAANRWLVPGGGTLTLSPGQSATWRYDATTQRWRLKEYTG